MTPDKEAITKQLLLLPGEIAAESTTIVNLLIEKSKVDQKIDEIETVVKFAVGTNPDLKNDTARRAATQDMLVKSKEYKNYIETRDAVKRNIDLITITHQQKRDMMNCLIATIGVR